MRHGNDAPLVCKLAQDGPYDFITGQEPANCETFKGYGRQTQSEQDQTLSLLQRLSRFMFIAGRRSCAAVENPAIPAGYTYLAQLASHDLTFAPNPLTRDPQNPNTIQNLRSSALDLDCIYGGGPDHSPWFYQLEGEPGAERPRRRLRLGFTSDKTAPQPEDIPRICSNHHSNNLPDAARFRPYEEGSCLYEALIADPRNENTLILSQLVVLFHRLHNRIVDLVEASSLAPDERDIFGIARAVTVSCYRSVLVQDLLGRLLDPEVWSAYQEKNRAEDFTFFSGLLRKHSRIVVPLEFSHAGWRVGHVMVRPRYRFNATFNPTIEKLLVFNGDDLSTEIPIANNWVIDWSVFFPALDQDGRPQGQDYNASRCLRPAITYELYKSTRFQVEDEVHPGGGDALDRGGLIYRDLARGFTFGLPNGQALARTFGVPVLSEAEIADGLAAFDPKTAGEPNPVEAEIGLLSKDTPLLYYILREAEVRHGGQRLGKLGSSVVAEVVLGSLAASRALDDPATAGWVSTILGCQGLPRTMPDLIELAG